MQLGKEKIATRNEEGTFFFEYSSIKFHGLYNVREDPQPLWEKQLSMFAICESNYEKPIEFFLLPIHILANSKNLELWATRRDGPLPSL